MGEAVGRAVGALFLIGLLVIYFEWGDIVRLTADGDRGDIALWVWATDAAPGDTLDARARVDGGERASIEGIRIRGGGERQYAIGDGIGWGQTITARKYDSAASTHDFTFRIPESALPGSTIELEFEVFASEAVGYVTTYSNQSVNETFTISVDIYSKTTSALHRLGRVVLAFGSWCGVIALIVIVRGWYARRKRRPSSLWYLLALPYSVLGYVWFYNQLSAATRFHGLLLALAAIVGWMMALVVAARLVKYRYLPRYTVHPALIPTEATEPYRAADVRVTTKPLFELEAAWAGAGFVTLRRKDYLEVKLPTGVAIVPIPPSEAFGGEPFEIRSHDRNELIDLLEVTSKVLGPLSCKELRDAPFPYVG